MGQFCSRRKRAEDGFEMVDVASKSRPDMTSIPSEAEGEKSVSTNSRLQPISDYWKSKQIPDYIRFRLLEASEQSDEELISTLLSLPPLDDERIVKIIELKNIEKSKIIFPIFFDFFENSQFQFATPNSVWGPIASRATVADLYIGIVARWISSCGEAGGRIVEELVVNQSIELLSLGVRTFLGRRPARNFPSIDNESSLSPHVFVLVVLYRLLSIWGKTEYKLSDFFSNSSNPESVLFKFFDSANQFDDNIVNVVKELRKVTTTDNQGLVDMSDFSNFEMIQIVSEWMKINLDEIIIKYLKGHISQRTKCLNFEKIINVLRCSKMSISANDRIISSDKLFVRFILELIYSPTIFISKNTTQMFEELYQMLPIRDGLSDLDGEWNELMDLADGFEVHFGIVRILFDFFNFDEKIFFSNFLNISKHNHRMELFVFQIIAATKRLWLTVSDAKVEPSKQVIRGGEIWWSEFLDNYDRCVVDRNYDQMLVTLLVNLVIDIEFETTLISFTDAGHIHGVIEEVAHRSGIDLRQIFSERLTCCEHDLTSFSNRILSRYNACKPLIEKLNLLLAIDDLCMSGRVSVGTASTVAGGGLFNALSVKINQQLGTGGWSKKRVAELYAQRKFFSSKNFGNSQKPLDVFKKVFTFNPLAFLDTERVQKVCRLLEVKEGTNDYAFVLHCAGISYLMVGEVDGALSIADRLLYEYMYSDAWRLVVQVLRIGMTNVPSKILVRALETCPIEEIELFFSSDEFRNHAHAEMGSRGKVDVIRAFPDLSDDDAVSDFIAHVGGDEVGMTYHSARLLAGIESLLHPDKTIKELMAGIVGGSIRVS